MTSNDDTLFSGEPVPLSSKYRKFLFSGIGRVIVTRLISLLYIYIVSRYIPVDVQDLMILLADWQFVVGILATLGYSYSLTRQTIIDEDKTKILFSGVTTVILIGIPITIVMNVVLVFFADLSFTGFMLYMIACISYLFYQIIIIVEDVRLKSDRKVLILSIYSVLSSLLVPLLYIVFESIEAIVLAWILCYLLIFIIESKVMFTIFKGITIDFKASWEVFLFGMPVFLVTAFAYVVQRVDRVILFTLFPSGELSEYYWAWRLATTVQEVNRVVLTGALPLITTLFNSRDKKTYESRTRSFLRGTILISVLLYSGVFVESIVIITVILSNAFSGSMYIFQIIIIALLIHSTAALTYQLMLVEGKRRYVVELYISENVIRIVLLVFLSQIGGVGVAYVLLLQYAYVAFYHLIIRFRKFALNSLLKIRYIGFIAVFMVFILLLPKPTDLISGFMTGMVILVVYGLALLVFKPLQQEDIELIDKILGERFKPVVRLFNYASSSSPDPVPERGVDS